MCSLSNMFLFLTVFVEKSHTLESEMDQESIYERWRATHDRSILEQMSDDQLIPIAEKYRNDPLLQYIAGDVLARRGHYTIS